jgi:hypothetical protein
MSAPQGRALRVFTDDTDTFAAVDETDLKAAWVERLGGDEEYFEADTWSEVPPEHPFTVWCEDGIPGEVDGDGSERLTLTAAEWAARLGRGFLFSTEF